MKNIPTKEFKVSKGILDGWSSAEIWGLQTLEIGAGDEWWAYVRGDSLEQAQEISKLFCDAGNTYNQTQLTPSEILAQRNEAVKVLKYSLAIFTSIADTEELTEGDLVNVAIKKIQSLISKIEKP